MAMTKALKHFSFITIAIRPNKLAKAGNLVIAEFALIQSAVREFHLTLAMQIAIGQFAIVNISVLEMNRALNMETLRVEVIINTDDITEHRGGDQLTETAGNDIQLFLGLNHIKDYIQYKI